MLYIRSCVYLPLRLREKEGLDGTGIEVNVMFLGDDGMVVD